MDLLITADVVAAHLAGALARSVWLPLPKDADWRWVSDREDSPWYPDMRLYRQEMTGCWEALICRVSSEPGAWSNDAGVGKASPK